MEHREETTALISGDKVAGTNVYNTGGDRLGEIHDVMLDKTIRARRLCRDVLRRLPRHR